MTTLTLPADSPFLMKIHLKSQTAVTSVRLVKNRNGQKLSQYLSNKNFRFMRPSWDSTAPTLNVRFAYGYNKDTTDQINADIKRNHSNAPKQQPAGVLKTGNMYTLLIFSKIHPKIFSLADSTTFFAKCYAYCKCLDTGAANGSCQSLREDACKYYKGIIDSYKLKINDPKFELFPKGSDDAIDYFRVHIYSIYRRNDDSVAIINSQIDSLSQSPVFLQHIGGFRQSLLAVANLLDEGKCPIKYGNASISCPDSSCAALSYIKVIWKMWPRDWRNVNKGMYTLDKAIASVYSSANQAANPDKMLQHIDSTIQQLLQIRTVLSGIEMIRPRLAEIREIYHLDFAIMDELGKLVKIKSCLSQLNQITKDFQAKVINYTNNNFQNIDVYSTGSYIMDFQTRSAIYITPVFGYAAYGFQKNFVDFSPYLGFQINFKPIASKIPFSLIKPIDLLQRFCFTTAWTIKSVSYPGKRQDFFGNSTSLITAVGYKFGHYFMFNAGTLWFKELNPNPILTDKKIVCTPLAALSVNFSVSQLLNGFTNLIPSL